MNNNISNGNLLVTGGIERPNGFELGDGKFYGAATLLSLSPRTGEFKSLLKVDQGNENFPAEHPNLQFTAACPVADALWLPMDCEIRRYSYPDLTLEATFSHPCFNNVHSVCEQDDALYLTSTGIDTVVVLDKVTGALRETINADGRETWHRFSPDVDYRQVYSTRPHECHPNFIFWHDGGPWVTRCKQEDAVRLTDFNDRIDVSVPDKRISVHDGLVTPGAIYFTSVDGCVIRIDPATNQQIDVIDVSEFAGFGGIRGWCRGLHYDAGLLYLGFSRLRPTRAIDNIRWLRRFTGREMHEEASILAVDLEQKTIAAEYKVPAGMSDAIYSIIPEPGQTPA